MNREIPRERIAEDRVWSRLLHPFASARRRRIEREKREFATELTLRLNQTARAGHYVYESPSFALCETETGRVLPLETAFRRLCCASDEEVESVLQESCRALLFAPVPGSLGEALPNLTFDLRCRAAYETARLAGDTSLPVAQQVSEGLLVALVYVGSSIHACSERIVEGWGCTRDAAFRAVLERGPLAHERPTCQSTSEGVWVVSGRRRVGHTLLRLGETLEALGAGDEAIVMIPDAGTLLIGDGARSASIRSLVRLASQWAGPRLSGTAWRWRGEQLERCELDDGALALEVRSLEIDLELRAFEAQRTLLTALRAGSDAPCLVLRAERDLGPLPRTLCRWERPGEALLPVTDRLCLPPLGKESAGIVLEWAEAMARLGDRVECTGLFPKRVRVRGLPSADVLLAGVG